VARASLGTERKKRAQSAFVTGGKPPTNAVTSLNGPVRPCQWVFAVTVLVSE